MLVEYLSRLDINFLLTPDGGSFILCIWTSKRMDVRKPQIIDV